MSTISRIRIALDYSPPNPATLEWTARLARRLQAQMEARFIEDQELFRIAELPFTHCGSGRFDTETLDREMHEQARQLEQQLQALASREELSLQFSRVRGQLLDEIRRASEDVSLLVLQGFQPKRPSLVAPSFPKVGEAVMFLFDASEASTRALEVALQSLPTEALHVLIQVENREQVEEKAALLTGLAERQGIQELHTGFLPLHDGEHLIHLARLERPAAIFLARNNPLLADHPMRELISALPCPLVIVGATS